MRIETHDINNVKIADFIYESNKSGHINFVTSLPEAIKVLSNK